ncbi:MAG: RidA family protein [Flavobacteriaceae bacterium]
MSRINYSSGSPFEKEIGFSRAVRAGNQIFVSGTAPLSTDGSTAFPGDAYSQTKTCLELMKKIIEQAGGQWHSVVRTRIYLKNAADWKEVAKAHSELLSDIQPACTFIEVKGFIDPDWLVETEAHCIL